MKFENVKTAVGKGWIRTLTSNKVFTDSIVGLSFFALTFLTVTGLQIFNFSHASTDFAAVVTQTGYYINTTSSSINDSISLNVDATPAGTMAIAKDTLNIKSNVPNGYNVYISMEPLSGCTGSCTALYRSGSAENIPAVSGSFSNPVALSANTWGFAIARNTTGAPSNNFSTSYNPSVPDSSAVFSALPLKGSDQLIQSIQTPNSSSGIDLNLYYGVNVNTSKTAGVYRGSILYTIVSKDVNGVADIASVSPDVTDKLEGGERITIATDYNYAIENLGAVKVYLNSLTSSKECTNLVSSTVGGKLVITCDSPAYDTGKYDVRIVIPGYSKDITLVKSVSYIVNSVNSKNLRTTIQSNFDATSLSSTVPSDYYAGDNLPLSDLIPVYTQQYDDTKTAEQNTQDAGITLEDDGSYTVESGYHSEQNIPKQSGGAAGGVYMRVTGVGRGAGSVNIGTFIQDHNLDIDCTQLSVAENFVWYGHGAQCEVTIDTSTAWWGGAASLSYNANTCVLSYSSTQYKNLFINGAAYLVYVENKLF